MPEPTVWQTSEKGENRLQKNIVQINIVQGNIEYLPDCIEAHKYSELGEIYHHPDEEMAEMLTDGFYKGEIYVALDEDGNCLGFIWIALYGAFYGFPYCRILAVKKRYRGKGVGTALLNHYEKMGFARAGRLFILVSDFNERARKLYERLGFVQVGTIPDLFKKGIKEFVMVRYRPEEESGS